MAPFSFSGIFCLSLLLLWFVLELWGFSGHFSFGVSFLPVLWRFSGHSPFAWRFVPVLPPKQGCFVASRRFSPGIVGFFGIFFSGAAVCPGFVALFRTFSFRVAFCPGFTAQTRMFCCCRKIFSWNCGVFRDISFPARRFVPVSWRFLGHFPSVAMVCPGIVGFFGIFPFCGVLSGLINIILLSVCGFIIFAPQNLTK